MPDHKEKNENEEQNATEEELNEVIAEEEKTHTKTQFDGLLRDKQSEILARQEAQADAAAAKQQAEDLRVQLEAKNETKGELSEDESEDIVTRGQLQKSLDKMVKDITMTLEKKTSQKEIVDLQKDQRKDVQALMKSHSVAKMGEGLDASTIVNEAGAWLRANKPDLFEAAKNSPDFATEIYNLGVAYVPSIKAKVLTRNKEQLLEELKNPEKPPGGGGGDSPEGSIDDICLDIMYGTGTMTDDKEVDKVMGRL